MGTATPTATAPLTLRVVTRDEDFGSLAPRWDALLGQAEGANNFLSHEWLWSWWRAYRPAGELRLVLAESGGELAGIAPLFLRVEKQYGVSYRVLRFVGDGTAETDHMNFLVRARDRAAVLGALLAKVAAMPDWDAARLNQIPKPSPNAEDLLSWCRSQGLLLGLAETPCPLRRMPESYDALLASLQSRFRGKLRSTRKKLEEKYRVEFGLHTAPAEFPEALETLFRNHASRWAAKGQGGVFVAAPRRAFYASLTEAFHRRGWLRFFYLKLDGKIIAQEYCFEYGGTVSLLQEGFDFARAEENVGNALRGYIFEWCIGEKKRAYDFLAGISRHKQIWADANVPDILVEACRPTWKGRLYYRLPRLVEAAKDRVKKILRKDAAPAAGAPEKEDA